MEKEEEEEEEVQSRAATLLEIARDRVKENVASEFFQVSRPTVYIVPWNLPWDEAQPEAARYPHLHAGGDGLLPGALQGGRPGGWGR